MNLELSDLSSLLHVPCHSYPCARRHAPQGHLASGARRCRTRGAKCPPEVLPSLLAALCGSLLKKTPKKLAGTQGRYGKLVSKKTLFEPETPQCGGSKWTMSYDVDDDVNC